MLVCCFPADYFERIPGIGSLPARMNPATSIVDAVARRSIRRPSSESDPALGGSDEAKAEVAPVSDLNEHFNASPEFKQLLTNVDRVVSVSLCSLRFAM
jgi:hypothetical protein